MLFYPHWTILKSVHSKNEQGSAIIDKSLYSPFIPSNEKIGKCPICKKEDTLLVPYRLYKDAVFGDFKKESVEGVCKRCKRAIKHTNRIMENEILQKFASTYERIWESFILNKHFPQNVLKVFVEDQFKKIKIESYNNQISPEADDCCCGEKDEIIGTCPSCKKEGIKLTKHHPLRKKVFGSSNDVVFLCRNCHDQIENIVTRFEKLILRKFFRCYREIWKEYINNGFISDDKARKLAEESLITLMINKGLLVEHAKAREAAVAVEAN